MPRVPSISATTPRGFTLIELLVVITIITVLLSAVIVASSTVVNKGKIRNTTFVLAIVRDAVEEFKREQTETPTIIRARQGGVSYKKRYGFYPPDELEVFSEKGLPNSGSAGKSLAPGQATVVPEPGGGGYPDMRVYPRGDESDSLEHRDLAAMILAIELLSQSAAEILDRAPDAHRSSGALDAEGRPIQFLNRGGGVLWKPEEDHQIRYIVDSWGLPISYFSQRDFVPKGVKKTGSSNFSGWNQASTEMIRLNGDQPIIMSYGPDGREQITREVIEADDSATLVGDWMHPDSVGRVFNPLNEDNIYADAVLKDKLAKGIN